LRRNPVDVQLITLNTKKNGQIVIAYFHFANITELYNFIKTSNKFCFSFSFFSCLFLSLLSFFIPFFLYFFILTLFILPYFFLSLFFLYYPISLYPYFFYIILFLVVSVRQTLVNLYNMSRYYSLNKTRNQLRFRYNSNLQKHSNPKQNLLCYYSQYSRYKIVRCCFIIIILS